MEIETILSKQPVVQSHHTIELNIVSYTPNRQNISNEKKVRKKSTTITNISKERKMLYECIESPYRNGFMVVLFISLSIVIGVLIVCLRTSTSNNNCQSNFERTMKSSLVSSSQPRSVALGDLNNDQNIDIVVSNSGTDTIGIFISKGNGTFTEQQTYSTDPQSRPYSVVINDFNNDNYLDIAVANYDTNNIGIFLNRGNGTFKDQEVFLLGSSRPIFISTADFNQDNRMDIVIVNHGTNNIGILLGYGNGSFQNQTTYSTGYDSFPSSLAVGDFNRDHQLDIAVANYGTDNIGIFLGYGSGTFTNQQTYSAGLKSKPSSIAVGDFNNDGKLDIVIANYGTGNIGIFFGDGNGSFQAQTTYSTGSNSYPLYITVGDPNKDNALDILIVDSKNNDVHILLGYGNGSFATLTTYDAISGSHPLYAAISDFNNNNMSDIVVVNHGTNNVLVLTDYSNKPSAKQTNYDTGPLHSAVSVAVGDFNNDHLVDVVYGTLGDIHIRFGLADGTLGSDTTYSIGDANGPQYICVGDLNNDTKLDIVSAYVYSDSVGVLLGNGDGSFTNITEYSTGIGSGPMWVALGDFNNDDRLDIVSANTGTNTIGIFLGDDNETFGTMIIYSISHGSQPYSIAVGDLNNDDYLDMVVVNGNGYVVVFRGYGDGNFTIWNVFSTIRRSFSFAIALGNFNSDNYLDITISNTFINCMSVFLGDGNGMFEAQTTYDTGSNSEPYYVIVDDFNNDNISDIAASNHGKDQLVMFYGLGNGSFKFDRSYSTGIGSTPYGMAAADFDNDKQLEIVVALAGIKQIAILSEYYTANFDNQTKYLTGSAPQPYSVAIGDFNNDNRSDIVVANSGTDDLDILFSSSNGTFDRTMKYPIGIDFDPQYVITCDVNKDNELDIISVNSNADSISVILGYGNGTFAEQLIYSTGNDSHPVSVAAGDLNKNNRLDLVITNENSNNIGIFFGFDYTIFQRENFCSNDDSLGPVDIHVADLNNDTYLDIAAVFHLSDDLGIFLGYGNSSFTTIITYSTGSGSGPSGIAIDDLNKDGRLDIIVTNYDADSIGVFLGYGNGNFNDVIFYSTGKDSSPRAAIVGDFNNDSQLDIVVANYGSNSVGILLGYGNGRFSNVTIYSTGEASNSFSVTAGDFNDDHNLDIAVANYGTRNVGILLGHGDGTFENQTFLPMGLSARPIRLTVGDFNNDNQLDIAVANWNDHNLGVFLGYGNGSFSPIKSYSTGDGSAPRDISVDDFNNDNISDIAVVNQGTDNFVVLFGLGDGDFLLGTAHSTGIGSEPLALAAGDFNNDNRLDIATANTEIDDIGVFLAYDTLPFGSLNVFPMGDGSKPHSVAVSDLNNDSCADIIVANSGTNNLSILFGHCDGNFQPMIQYSTGNDSAPSFVVITDLNNDTHMDIVVANSQTDDVLILLGCSNGTFTLGMRYSTGARSQPYAIATGDLNNDTIPDIAVANFGTNSIVLLYGYGDGRFGNETSYPLGYNYRPHSIAMKEFSQHNGIAIVVACYGTDHIEIFIKTCL